MGRCLKTKCHKKLRYGHRVRCHQRALLLFGAGFCHNPERGRCLNWPVIPPGNWFFYLCWLLSVSSLPDWGVFGSLLEGLRLFALDLEDYRLFLPEYFLVPWLVV